MVSEQQLRLEVCDNLDYCCMSRPEGLYWKGSGKKAEGELWDDIMRDEVTTS